MLVSANSHVGLTVQRDEITVLLEEQQKKKWLLVFCLVGFLYRWYSFFFFSGKMYHWNILLAIIVFFLFLKPFKNCLVSSLVLIWCSVTSKGQRNERWQSKWLRSGDLLCRRPPVPFPAPHKKERASRKLQVACRIVCAWKVKELLWSEVWKQKDLEVENFSLLKLTANKVWPSAGGITVFVCFTSVFRVEK